MKKGFTLIELLAVILILGIIALIAVPTVNSVIKQSRKGSLKATVQNVISAIENKCERELIKSDNITTEYDFSHDLKDTLEVKGSLPTNGIITVDNDCKVNYVNVSDNSYNIVLEDDEIVINDGPNLLKYTKYNNGDTIYFNPTTGEKCSNYVTSNSLSLNKDGCLKWYAFNDSDKNNKVDLLLDHNIGITAWNDELVSNKTPSTVINTLFTLTDNWSGIINRKDSYTFNTTNTSYTINYNGHKARLISADEVSKITSADTTLEWTSNKPFVYPPVKGESISFYYLDGAKGTSSTWQTKISSSASKSSAAWLFDYTLNCTNNGCNYSETTGSVSYYTSTAQYDNTTTVWEVSSSGMLDNFNVKNASGEFASTSGIRPVITVEKKKLT